MRKIIDGFSVEWLHSGIRLTCLDSFKSRLYIGYDDMNEIIERFREFLETREC